jgi:hypothetical protein
MPINVNEVMLGTAALMNDQTRAVYTNTVQLPYFKMAYAELADELKDNNVPISNRTSVGLPITQGMIDIGGPTGPPLPIDFIEPLALWERTAGTTNDFMLMDRRQFLPKTSTLTSFLQVWTYINQIITLLGTNGDIEVKIDYVGDPFANIVNENSLILVHNAENFLKYRNAALCAEFIGEDESRASSLNNNAGRELETLLNIAIKSEQSIYTRRRPFRARFKSTGRGSNRW